MLDVIVGHCRLHALRQVAEDAAARLQGQDDVFADRQIGHDALRLAIFRAEGDALLHRFTRRVEFDCLAVDDNRPAVGRVDAEQRAGRFDPAGAEQAAQPEYLALVDVEVDRMNSPG